MKYAKNILRRNEGKLYLSQDQRIPTDFTESVAVAVSIIGAGIGPFTKVGFSQKTLYATLQLVNLGTSVKIWNNTTVIKEWEDQTLKKNYFRF